MTRPALLLLAAMLALSGCGTYAEDVRRISSFDEETGVPVTPGMSPEQVLKLIGTPTKVKNPGTVTWYYAALSLQQEAPSTKDIEARRRLTAVYFGPDRKVGRVAFYVKVDGNVIDAGTRMAAEDEAAEVWRTLYEKERS